MTKQEYIKEIMRGLDLKKSEKKRIEADLDSDIQAALEQGESMDEVIRRIGEPRHLQANGQAPPRFFLERRAAKRTSA